MNIFSWSLEFIAGGFSLVYYLFSIGGKEKGWTMWVAIDIFVYSILVSSSYLLKSESVKNMVINHGWLAPFARQIFECLMFGIPRCCKTSVSPVEQIDVVEIPNINLFRAIVRPHIPTISGQIERDLKIEDI